MNLPPLGCVPGTRIIDVEQNGECLQQLSDLSSLHNRVLHRLLLHLAKKLKGFKFALYDFNTDLTQMMNHPFKYGMSLTLELIILNLKVILQNNNKKLCDYICVRFFKARHLLRQL